MFELDNLRFKNILNLEHLRIGMQITCIVGASGSGKTTLLRMLNRMYRPDAGIVRYNGEDIAAIDPVILRRRVVMLGQSPILYPGTVRDNLQIGLELSDRPPADETTLRGALERVSLEKGLDEGCGSLSGGEKMRLCLARVLLLDAQCYLLDEPSSALDSGTERFIIESLAGFATTRNKQLVLVTHSEHIAQSYPEGMIRLENGSVRGDGL